MILAPSIDVKLTATCLIGDAKAIPRTEDHLSALYEVVHHVLEAWAQRLGV